MGRAREHVPTSLRLTRDTLALIDETIAKAREEFDDPEIDRQRVRELLVERPRTASVFREVVRIDSFQLE